MTVVMLRTFEASILITFDWHVSSGFIKAASLETDIRRFECQTVLLVCSGWVGARPDVPSTPVFWVDYTVFFINLLFVNQFSNISTRFLQFWQTNCFAFLTVNLYISQQFIRNVHKPEQSIYKVKKVTWLLRSFVCPLLSLVRFRHSITLCRYNHSQYNESVHRNEQIATGINTMPKHTDFIHGYFGETTDWMQYRPPNAYDEASKHEPVRLSFWQSKPTRDQESMHG